MYHKVTLPDYLLPFIVCSHEFDNIMFRSISGRDYVRNKTDILTKYYYIRSARISKDEYKDFVKFYSQRFGTVCSFDIFDFFENYIKLETIALGGVGEERRRFSLKKLLNILRSKRAANITSIIRDSIKIYIDEEEIDFRYIDDEMEIEIDDALAEGSELKVSFNYYSKIRFISPKIEGVYQRDGSIALNDIILREVIGE